MIQEYVQAQARRAVRYSCIRSRLWFDDVFENNSRLSSGKAYTLTLTRTKVTPRGELM